MRGSARVVAASAAAVLAAVAGASPGAVAAPGGPGGHGGHGGHGGGHHDGDSAGATKLERAQKRALREVAHDVDGVRRATSERRLAGLDEAARTALTANATADTAALAGLGEEILAATSPDELAEVLAVLDSYRPETYRIVVNQLRFAERLAAGLDEATLALEADPAADPEALAALVAAGLLLDTAVADAQGVTATSPRSLLREIRRTLSDAQAAHDAVVGDPAAGDTGDDSDDGGDDGTPTP